MFVAKVIDGQIADTGKLKDLFPNTSFPASGPSESWMDENNVVVIKSYRDYDRDTQQLATADPYLEDGEVYDVEVVELSDTEVAEKTAAETARKEKAVRDQRNRLLAETDYFALTDVTMSAEMEAYRQALRDITSHENFPDLNSGGMDDIDSDWPVKPEL